MKAQLLGAAAAETLRSRIEGSEQPADKEAVRHVVNVE